MKKLIRPFTRHLFSTRKNQLVFFVNGEEHVVDSPSSHLSLARYLRDTDNKSVKLGCEEGGCGACCILVQNHSDEGVETVSVNSCLTSLCSVDGCHVVTLEGLENSELMQEIQSKFVEHNATQCGFCTPGFEMAIYQYLTGQEEVSEDDIETALSGNLCRCTGYRSIVDAVQDLVNVNIREKVSELFPEKLKKMPMESKVFQHKDGTIWHNLANVDDLLDAKGEIEAAKIINGGTELLLLSNIFGEKHDTLLYTGRIKEMNYVKEENGMLKIGSSTTLSKLERYCEENIDRNGLFREVKEILELFAGVHVRNVASLAGNIINASPTSDLNPIWLSTNASFVLQNSKRKTRVVEAKDFFIGYKKVDIKPDEVMMEVRVPLLKKNEFLGVFKQARRREDDIAIVNSSMRIQFDEDGLISSSDFAFGGMSPVTVLLKKLPEILKGKKLNNETLGEAINVLIEELPLMDQAPGGMVEYRRSLTLSFFYKFYLRLAKEFYGVNLGREESSIKPFKRPPTRGEVKYDIFQQGTSVGLPEDSLYGVPQAKGTAKYVDDIPKIDGEKVGFLLLSEVPHGTIKKLDPTKALEMDGVFGWIDHKDIPGHNEFGVAIMDEELIVSDTVTCTGQVMGMIIADDVITARRAAKLVEVEIEEKKPIISIDDAIENDSFFDYAPNILKGDTAKGFEEADKIIEGELYVGGQDHFCLEPQGCLVEKPDEDKIFITSSSQNVSAVQFEVSQILGIPQNNVVVRTKRLGGGFGGKESRAGVYAGCGAVAAKKYNVPIRVILDRHQDMVNSGQRHPFKMEYKVGYSKDGSILAIEGTLYSNAGFSTDLSYPIAERALLLFDNCYNIPNLKVVAKVCKTNKPTNTAMRGFGGPQGMFFMEQIIDKISRDVKIDSKLIRDKHMYELDGEKTPFGMEMYKCQAKAVWSELEKSCDYEEQKKEIEEFNKQNKHKKRGLYMTPIKFGISFAQTFLNQGGSLVHVYKDGSVLISHGGVEMGQGLHTKVRQVAASTLGIASGKIEILETNTDKVANTSPTSASCGSDLNSMATQIACEAIIERLEPVMKDMNYPEDCTWEELVWSAYFQRINLTGQGFYATPGLVNMDWETGQGIPFRYFNYGAASAVVEIDTLTGDHNLENVEIVFDVGRSLNPKIDIGQIIGAFVQGYGYLTMEEVVFGDSDHSWVNLGKMQSVGPGFYKIPTAGDLPIEMNCKLLPESDNPFAVLSSKGIGEPPFCLANCVYFAAKDAIVEARKENNVQSFDDFTLDAPLTAERIRMACHDELISNFVDEDFKVKGSY